MNDAQHLKTIRTRLGLNQKEMADKMGFGSQQYISMVETGERTLSGVARKLLECIEEHEIIT